MRLSGTLLSTRNRTNTQKILSATSKLERGLMFLPITKAHIQRIRPFLGNNSYRTCDYTLGGIFMWVDYFDYQFAVLSDTLFIKGISEGNRDLVAFSLPLGALSLQSAVTKVLDYCAGIGLKPVFSAVPTVVGEELARLFGGDVLPLNGWSDYLYDAHSLASLQGKAYSKKRNHVNRFVQDNPNYKFEQLNASSLREVMGFIDDVDVSEKSNVLVAGYELAQCKDVLVELRRYGFEGRVLRSEDGSVCAVTVGEVVGDTLYVHIEKMSHTVAGSGETINKLFASEIISRYPNVRYINREEDMGDEGLRFAKESYHPVVLLDKCDVHIN